MDQKKSVTFGYACQDGSPLLEDFQKAWRWILFSITFT
jgi:hypothetical protein